MRKWACRSRRRIWTCPVEVVEVKVKVAQSCPTLHDPMDYTVHGILQAKILEWVAFPFSRQSSQPRVGPRSPALQADSLPAEPQGTNVQSTKWSCSVVSDSLWPHGLYSPWNSPGQNTEVGSLSLFQGIFPTRGLNPGLPHCRRILDQLSHKGSPISTKLTLKEVLKFLF